MLKKVVIGCSGSVAVFTIPSLILLLRRSYDCEIVVLMSETASRFVALSGLMALAGEPVLQDDPWLPDDVLHQRMRGANALLVAPATANTISKMATGLCADLLPRSAMLFDGPIVIAPAMNERMWQHPATQANVRRLTARGMAFVGPGPGIEVATFEASSSSLASLDEIVNKVIEVARPAP